MNDELRANLQAVQELASLFRLERYVHLGISAASAVLLLICSALYISSHTANVEPTVLSGLVGSSGSIVWSTGRVLRMWDQAIALVMGRAKVAA